jgi:hypothetical protein
MHGERLWDLAEDDVWSCEGFWDFRGPGGLVSRLLERQFDLALFLTSLFLVVRDRAYRCIDAERLREP